MTEKEVTLEAYKDLSAWNKQDFQTVVSFDKIFLPVAIGGYIASVAADMHHYAFVGKVLLLVFWILLSCQYSKKIEERFCIMKKMESCLGFEAYTQLPVKNMTISPNMRCRKIIFWVVVVLGAVVSIHKIVCELKWWSLLCPTC